MLTYNILVHCLSFEQEAEIRFVYFRLVYVYDMHFDEIYPLCLVIASRVEAWRMYAQHAQITRQDTI